MAFPSMMIPPFWKDLVRTLDTHGSLGCSLGSRKNLFVTDDTRIFSDMVETPTGMSLEGLMRCQLTYDEEKPLDTFRFLREVNLCRPNTKLWLLDVRDDITFPNADVHIDVDTVILPLPPGSISSDV